MKASLRTRKASRGIEIGDPVFKTGTAAVDQLKTTESFGNKCETARVVGKNLGETGNGASCVKRNKLKHPSLENEHGESQSGVVDGENQSIVVGGESQSIVVDDANHPARKQQKVAISATSAPSSTDIPSLVVLHDSDATRSFRESKIGVNWDDYTKVQTEVGKD